MSHPRRRNVFAQLKHIHCAVIHYICKYYNRALAYCVYAYAELTRRHVAVLTILFYQVI